jgi:type VI secretion system protein VasI
MKAFSIAALVVVTSLPALAQDGPTAEECFELQGKDFLSCMQRRNNRIQADILREQNSQQEGTEDSDSRAEFASGIDALPWVPSITQSPLDDSTTVVLQRQSDDTVEVRFRDPFYPTLVIRCRENTTNVYISFGIIFMSDIQGYGTIDYRIDNLAPQKRNLRVSTNNTALGEWSGRGAIRWLEEMFGASTIFVRATPYNESPIEMRFNIKGLEQAVEPLREACSW